MRIGTLLQACLGLAVVVTPQIGLSAQDAGKPLLHFATAPHGERNRMRLQRRAERIELRDDEGGTLLAAQPFDATSEVVIDGSDGDDTLIVDFTNGSPVPPGGLTFNGGDQATTRGDVLEIEGASFATVSSHSFNAHDGTIELDGATIRYTGLEPIVNTGTVADMVLTLPGGVVGASLEDDGTPGNNMVQLRSTNGTFETMVFTVPTNSLTVNGGGGTDTITAAADLSADFDVGLTIDGSPATDTVTLNTLSLPNGSGALAVTARTINLNGAIATSGAQIYDDAVTLAADTTLVSTGGGNVTFGSTIDGSYSLLVNTSGPATFYGAVGGTTALTSIAVTAGMTSLLGPGVFTTGAQLYANAVTLGADTTLTSAASGAITFGSTVNGPFVLNVDAGGAIVFGGAVGGTTPLTSIVAAGAGSTALDAGSIVTTGAQTYTDAVTLGANTILASSGSGSITFGSTVNGPFSLQVNTAGAAAFDGPVGGTSVLTSIAITAGLTALNGGSVLTIGAQLYPNPVVLGANTTLTSTAGGNIVLGSTVNGAFSLALNGGGTAFFGGAVGGTTPLTSIATSVAGSTVLGGGSVTTTGSQSYHDAVTLAANTALVTTGAGNIAFGSTVNGAFSLLLNAGGTTVFAGAVGGATPLTSIAASAAASTVLNGGSVTTTGSQTYNDAVTLGANTALASTGSGNITFGSTVNGTYSLTVSTAGTTRLDGAVGAIDALTSIATDAAGATVLNGGGVTTSGAQAYNDAVKLGADTVLTSAFDNIAFGSSVDGAFSLAVNSAGATIFDGAVGATTPLISIATGAAGSTVLNGGSLTTTGAQTYNGAVTLGADTMCAASGTVTFLGTITGGFALAKSGSGTMALSAPNTYGGGTNVYAGTLLVTNPSGSGTGSGGVTVASGATLGGAGTIAGIVTIQTGGRVAPGTSIGTLQVGGDVTWNGSTDATATAMFELSNNNSTSDRLAMTGAFDKGNGTTFKFDFQDTGHPTTYTLATFASTTFSALDFSFTNLAPGLDGAFLVVGGSTLQFTVASAAATHFAVAAPASATAGSAVSFTVTAQDLFNNPAASYGGTVHFTSSDGSATLPANATLSSGVGSFSATLRTAGGQTVTAADTANSSITGTSNSIAVSAAAATHVSVAAPASATAGSAFSFTVTALDQFNNTATGYGGTVHFTSSDGSTTLPAAATLSSGVGSFSATLRTAGTQTITATDTVNSSITGTSNSIAVSAAAATHFAVAAPASATAGSAFSFTVTALDQFNNTATGYGGTVHFTSSDGSATLPGDSTLLSGVGSFSATLRTAGTQTITATDTVNSSITGTSNSIAVSVAAPTHFAVAAPASATAGSAFSFTVTALDQFNNTATGYSGTVHFTSSDGSATLPGDSTLLSGVGSFSATLRTAGTQTITATDTANSSITGASNVIDVSLPTVDLSITKTASQPPYLAGSSITYTIVASNAGPADATGVTVSDTLPAGTTLTSAMSSQGSCSGTTTVTCGLGVIAKDGSATISLVLSLPDTVGPLSNTAKVSAANPDSNPANDAATAAIMVTEPIPALSILGLFLLGAAIAVIAAMKMRGQ